MEGATGPCGVDSKGFVKSSSTQSTPFTLDQLQHTRPHGPPHTKGKNRHRNWICLFDTIHARPQAQSSTHTHAHTLHTWICSMAFARKPSTDANHWLVALKIVGFFVRLQFVAGVVEHT